METLLLKALKALQNNQPCACVTIIESSASGTPRKIGTKMLIFEDGSHFGTIGGGLVEKKIIKQALKSIKTQKTAIFEYILQKKTNFLCGGRLKVFVEPFTNRHRLIICGAGHISLALSFIGKLLDFNVVIIDNRKKWAHLKRFPHVDEIRLGSYRSQTSCLKKNIRCNDFIVIATQGHDTDFTCLKTLIKTQATYIGVISSHTKKCQFLKKLKSLHISGHALKKLHMPVGLDIGAQTPEEIAISIASQIVSHINKNFLGSKKFKSHIKRINKYKKGVL